MKKLLSVILTAAVAFTAMTPINVKGGTVDFVLTHDVSAAMLVEYETGNVLFAYNEAKHVPIASITKEMTLILAFEAIEAGVLSYDTEITVSREAESMGGSGVFLFAGETVKIEDLFKAVIVASANDACVALAEAVAGSTSQFVALMNNKAKELGMNDTNFVNCTGLPSTGYYSSAKDVAVMSRELMKHEDYFRWSTIWLDKMDNIKNQTVITNTNKLIRFYTGCDGTKTGFTNDAMHCVAASAKRNGVRYIAVVLGAKSSDERFTLAKELLNYGFANYKTITVAQKGKSFDGSCELKVKLGQNDFVNGVTAESVSDFVEITAKHDYTVTSVPDEIISAPINEGDKIGEFIIYRDGEEIARTDMVAEAAVEKLCYKNYIDAFFARWIWLSQQ